MEQILEKNHSNFTLDHTLRLNREDVSKLPFPLKFHYVDVPKVDLGYVPWHWHSEVEINMVLEGELLFFVDEKQFHLKQGDGYFVNSDVLHMLRPAENCPDINVGCIFSENIKTKFVDAFNAILTDKDSVLEDCRLIQSALTDCSGLDAEIESLLEEIDVVTELTKRCIAENSQMAQNQEEYTARYNGFVERYEKAKARVEELRSIKTARQAQADAIGAFMFEVRELDTLSEFDAKLWLTVIDTVTVHVDGRMTFKFQGGTEIDA